MFGNKDYNAIKAKFDAQSIELVASKNTVNALKTQIDEHKSTIEASAIKIEDLQLQLDNTKKSVNAKVNAALTSIGVKNFAIETINVRSSMSPREALSKFNALNGQEKTEFYRKHKDLVTQGLNAAIKPNE